MPAEDTSKVDLRDLEARADNAPVGGQQASAPTNQFFFGTSQSSTLAAQAYQYVTPTAGLDQIANQANLIR